MFTNAERVQIGRNVIAAGKETQLRQEAERRRSYSAVYSREASRAVQEIGPLPEVVDPKRRKACTRNFRRFCSTYFPDSFHMQWSEDHKRVIKKIQTAVLSGGLFAMAMPRGSGKSTLCETAALWAVLYGHRRFPMIIGADAGAATSCLDSIKASIESNELLCDDFPEVCFPVAQLDGSLQRANGQRIDGQRTHIRWTQNQIVLPYVEGSAASGSTIRVAGLTGRLRGAKHKLLTGEVIRPDLVLLDDPQTDESAKSADQNNTRENLINGAVLGLAGPNVKISGLCACTVIEENDLAERLLDRKRNPHWQGERTKMVYKWPKNVELWDEYREVLEDGLRRGDAGKAGRKFYTDNRQAMDEGAEVAWPQRKGGDLSAIQHAFNLRFERGDVAFFAEFQNEPLKEDDDTLAIIEAPALAEKTNGHKRGVVPASCEHLTAFVDVQKACLWFTVVAWERSTFSGYVVDYGAWPDQKRRYFTLRDVKHTLQKSAPGSEFEGALWNGLENVSNLILGRDWGRDDGSVMSVDRMLVDANWGQSTDTVKGWARSTKYRSRVIPSHGKYVGASSKPISEYRKQKGDWIGHEWMMPGRATGATRHVLYDTNHWKTFLHDRLLSRMGDPGAMSLYDAKPAWHKMISEHVTAEYRVRTSGRGRRLDEWKLRPGAPDNHLLDCLVGSCVAASMIGVQLRVKSQEAVPSTRSQRKKVSYLKV